MTQIKVETTIYHFNSIYKGEKESKKRSVERMKERENKRERMRGRAFFLSRDALTWEG